MAKRKSPLAASMAREILEPETPATTPSIPVPAPEQVAPAQPVPPAPAPQLTREIAPYPVPISGKPDTVRINLDLTVAEHAAFKRKVLDNREKTGEKLTMKSVLEAYARWYTKNT